MVVVGRGFLGGLDGKTPPAVKETWVPSLGWDDPLEEGMATHSSLLENPHGQRNLAGPWTYSPWGCKESDTTERLSTAAQLVGNMLATTVGFN